MSDAFRLLLTRVAKDKALPFSPLIPNQETIEAIKAVRRGDVITTHSRKEFFESLNADD